MVEEESVWEQVIATLPPLDKRELESLQKQAAEYAVVDGFASLTLKQRTCTGEPSNPPAGGAFVDALEAAVKDYQSKRYGGGKDVTARHQIDTNDEGHLVLRTYAEMIDPHKTRTGYWAGCWIIETESSVRGTMSVHVYNYEDGNIQMRAQREMPKKDISTAEEVIKAIKRAEASLLSDVTDKDALTSSLKSIRRILPISKTRMKWDDGAQKAVSLLNKRNTDK